jgi:C1A family cysteine protease
MFRSLDFQPYLFNTINFLATKTSINWMSTGCVGPVKDQSYYCNSCWAFSAIATLEYYCCMKYKRKYVLSEQQLIDCNFNTVSGNWGCKGGSPGNAFIYAMQNGIQSMESYPYLHTSPTPTQYPCNYDKDKAECFAKGYMRIPPKNETLLRDIVASVGPVSAAMHGMWPSFWYYYDGIYDDVTCPTYATHSVLIVGFGTDVINGVSYVSLLAFCWSLLLC